MTDHDRIEDMSRAVHAWCIARTPTPQDAEDLAQDVLLAMLEALPNLHDGRAFYGFMWGVARNVYRQWAKKQTRRRECELTDAAYEQRFPADAPEDIALLRRELTLLSRRYREAAVMYYVHGMKTADIAGALSISQSMVKYLLFKARIKLKEGMEMERNYGMQSYQPRSLSLRYWGDGPNHYYDAANTLIRQNILFACYNDALTAEEIALEIGVGLPYMESDLRALTEVDLLRCKNDRYRTNIIIFTEDFTQEAAQRITPEVQAIAEKVKQFIQEEGGSIRALGFVGADMNEAAFVWQMTSILLHRAIAQLAEAKACLELPVDKWGVPCLCWGVECNPRAPGDFVWGAASMNNAAGDYIQFMDFPINGPMMHYLFYRSQTATNIFLSIAKGSTCVPDDEASLAAEMVKLGCLRRGEDARLTVTCPVYTQAQHQELLRLITPAAREIEDFAMTILRKETELLLEHAPEHLRDMAQRMAYFQLFDDAISRPMALLHAERFLPDSKTADLLPTTYVVLK